MVDFRKAYDTWTSVSLVLRIIIALVVGIVVALVYPHSKFLFLLGDAFIWALKAVAPFLVFFLVITAISHSTFNLGARFKTVIKLYLASTIIAAVIATVLCYLWPATVTFVSAYAPFYSDEAYEIVEMIVSKLICNPVDAFAEANFLGILTWAVIIGLFMKKYASETTKTVSKDISNIMAQVIGFVIQFAPIGIFGLIYNAVSENGLDIFTEYGHLIILLVAAMVLVMFVTNPLLAFIVSRRNPYPLLLKCLRGSAITAFFTRSSAANIPVNLKLCEELELDRDFYAVSIPLGATVNMNGAAITITVMTLAAANTLGISIPLYMAVALCVVAALSACGASGVNGGSLLLIPLACSMLGIPGDAASELIAIGFIIGVIQDSLETALNSSMDVFFTAIADNRERALAGKGPDPGQ